MQNLTGMTGLDCFKSECVLSRHLYALISKILTGVYVIYFVMIFFHLFIPPKIKSRRIKFRHSIR